MAGAEDPFVPLADWLRPAPPVAPERPPADAPPPAPDELLELLRDVRLFRARLADALEEARTVLARELGAAVLGRELLQAPAEIARVAAALLEAHPPAVRLRAAPADAATLRTACPVVPDAALAPGDLILELADGVVDARLGVRLATVLAAWR